MTFNVDLLKATVPLPCYDEYFACYHFLWMHMVLLILIVLIVKAGTVQKK